MAAARRDDDEETRRNHSPAFQANVAGSAIVKLDGYARGLIGTTVRCGISSVTNMAVGVIKAGYTVAQELPILLVVFAAPAALAMVAIRNGSRI